MCRFTLRYIYVKINIMKSSPLIPAEIIVNPVDKALIVTPELGGVFPEAVGAFHRIDEAFLDNPEAHLKNLEESVFSFHSKRGLRSRVVCSLIHGQNVGNELLVVYAPFSDGAPNSSSEDIYRYMINDRQDPISKSKAAPNSWGQATKSGVISELLQAIGRDMPVLTIFSPMPTHAYNLGERQDFKRGDFTAAARITCEAIAIAQERLHGEDSETQISKLHFQGASLGASNAIGSARGSLEDFDVRTVTAQELIIGPKNIFPDLAARFTVKSTFGEASEVVVPSDYARIAEPVMRRLIDRDGYELATIGRMLSGMSKLTFLKGLSRPSKNITPQDLEHLLENGVPVVVALAENSGLSHDTTKYLPNSGEDVIHVRAEAGPNGNRADHLIDEYIALTAIVAAINIKRN